MRKIKFRGKRVDNGEWVYGLLTYMNEMRVFTDKHWTDGGKKRVYQITEDFRVDPYTVGQWTGLKDKNNVDIYEGDIDQDGGVVFYNQSMASFQIDYGENNSICDFEDVEKWMIISSTIHDNPELLNK